MIILEKETDQYIQDYIAGHKLRFPGEAIMDICQKYREEKKKEWSLDTIMEAVSENLQEVGVTKIAEEVVEERILKQRQQRLDKEYPKRKSSLKPTFPF
ncbi:MULTISPECIES: hypothetical protein [Priestia]|uniref:hypothetical protein n=1 Tax=Priestia TaxID=2800373 RepID=UPI0011B36024|nr:MULTISPECIES: hypothetical protein [Priestia]MCG0050129.1 hypothetical protein [Priestia aryabhattai]QDZ88195.1 hypothetical protein D0441_28365 [Priestia megaterium]